MTDEKAKAQVAEYLETRKAVGEVYDPAKMPVMAARKFDHAGKVYDVVLSRFNTSIKDHYNYSVMVRERGAITGGFEVRRYNLDAACRDFMNADTSCL